MSYASMSETELRKESRLSLHIVHSEAIAELYEWIRTRKMEKEMDRLQRQQFLEEVFRTGTHIPYEEAYAAWRRGSEHRIKSEDRSECPIDPSATISIARDGERILIHVGIKGPQYWPGIARNIQEILSHKEYQG